MVVRFIVFLTSATLICRGTDISKCFREYLEIRDNGSQLYIDIQQRPLLEECAVVLADWNLYCMDMPEDTVSHGMNHLHLGAGRLENTYYWMFHHVQFSWVYPEYTYIKHSLSMLSTWLSLTNEIKPHVRRTNHAIVHNMKSRTCCLRESNSIPNLNVYSRLYQSIQRY